MARNRNGHWRSRIVARTAGLLLCLSASAAHAGLINIDISGAQSISNIGDAANNRITVDLNAELGTASGSRVTVVGIGWDVLISTFGPSWLSEALVQLQDGGGNGFLTVQPGRGFDLSGTEAFSSNGVVDLTSLGLSFVLIDGILTLEFGEKFNDNDGSDAVWGSSSAPSAISRVSAMTTADEPVSMLTLEVDINGIGVPAPATFLLMLGGLGVLIGRRRAAHA